MKKITITLIVLATIFTSFKIATAPVKDTKVFISNEASKIQSTIVQWSNYGYTIQSITPQSVSTSLSMHYATNNRSDVKGDIILVMTKN